jgi:NTP pyrophosphatase (non-canonical NTP hydrolase)
MNEVQHLFSCLSEECGEVLQAIGKCQRFGPDDLWPEIGLTNAEQVQHELFDILAVAEMLRERGALPKISGASMDMKIEAKKAKVMKMMDYAIERGTLTPTKP